VYSEPIDPELAARAADSLVLTEWKRAQERANAQTVERLFEDARAQARRYSEGPLAGFELTDYRYLVAVTWEDIEVAQDVYEKGIHYRHVNIPVAPRTPSQRR